MRKHITKIGLLIGIALACLLILSGCSFSDLMSSGTGVKNDPDYQMWEKLSDGGKLDAEGKYTNNNVYQKKMTYGEYRGLKPDKLQEQVKKFYKITLDTQDEFGEVEYQVNGISRQGTIFIRENDSLIIKYTLNNRDYEIEGELNVFTLNWAKQFFDPEVFFRREVAIPITPEINGKTITRDQYIIVKRKGE